MTEQLRAKASANELRNVASELAVNGYKNGMVIIGKLIGVTTHTACQCNMPLDELIELISDGYADSEELKKQRKG